MNEPNVEHHRDSSSRNDPEHVSRAHEDYLEAIVALGGTDKVSVRSVDIANQMDVSRPSVNKAVTALKQAHMLTQPHYGSITLTPAGYAYGKKVLERHTVLYSFLTDELGIEPEVANEEACLLEHDMSDSSFEKWIAFIKDVKAKK